MSLQDKPIDDKPSDERREPPRIRINREQIVLILLHRQINPSQSIADGSNICPVEKILRQLTDNLHLFSNNNDCLSYAEKAKDQTIFMIIDSSYASADLLGKLHTMQQINSIFIFRQAKDMPVPVLSATDYCKIVNVSDEQDNLTSSIEHITDYIDNQSTIFTVCDQDKQMSTRDVDQESGMFIFFQLVKKVIKKMLPNEDAVCKSKEEMINKCRLDCKDSTKDLENIIRFENEYTADQAIQWYTKDCFIYKLINKALRTEDIEPLYTYRFYINDLSACLAERCKLLREKTSKITVFRGAKISKAEIDRLAQNKGHLISTNGYFSTTWKRAVANIFAGIEGNNRSHSDLYQSILFEITVDLEKYPEIILADIQDISLHKDEEELLFDLDTVFKLESITYNDTLSYWTCMMSASNEGRIIVRQYLDFKEKELDNSDDNEVAFGNLLFDMGQWSKSRIYFENLALRRTNDPHIQFGIASCCRALGDINQALFHLQQAYDLSMHIEHECLRLKGQICCNLLRTYQEYGDFSKAAAFGDEALDFYRQAGEHSNEVGIAKVWINFGLLNYYKGHDDICLEQLERAHTLLKRTSQFDGPEISECYKFLSFAHYHNGDYDKALDSLMKESQITARLFPTNHPQTAATENNIGKQYYKQGKYEEALKQFRRAAEISERVSTTNSANQIVFLNNIGKALYRLKQIDEAE
ncbi:unnamed protein product, partial [Adineta ricciae]